MELCVVMAKCSLQVAIESFRHAMAVHEIVSCPPLRHLVKFAALDMVVGMPMHQCPQHGHTYQGHKLHANL